MNRLHRILSCQTTAKLLLAGCMCAYSNLAAAPLTVTRTERSVAGDVRVQQNGQTRDLMPFTFLLQTVSGNFEEELTLNANFSPASASSHFYQNSSITFTENTLRIAASGGAESTSYNGSNSIYNASANAWSNLDVQFIFTSDFIFSLNVTAAASGNGFSRPTAVVSLTREGAQIYTFGIDPRRPEQSFPLAGTIETTLPAGSYWFQVLSNASSISGESRPSALDSLNSSFIVDFTATAIPEPTSSLLILFGALAALFPRQQNRFKRHHTHTSSH